MKKIISFLIVIASIFSLTSCNKTSKIELKRDINITHAIDLYATKEDRPNIKKLVDNKESFVLYGYVPTCMDCRIFSKIYDDYVNKNKVVLYKSTTADIHVIEEKAPLRGPYLTIFREGKMNEVINFGDNKELFQDEKEFEKFMEEKTVMLDMPIVPDINKDTLDKWLSEDKEFIVYFGWNECSDCAYLNDAYMKDFMKENKKTFYYFETAPYRPNSYATDEEKNAWKEFKAQYGFGSYNEGRVPSICYYKNGKCVDFAVYLNDIIEIDEEKNTVTVVSSYYEDNPHIGEVFTGKNVGDAYSNYKEGSKDFFNQKLDEFFAKYLK